MCANTGNLSCDLYSCESAAAPSSGERRLKRKALYPLAGALGPVVSAVVGAMASSAAQVPLQHLRPDPRQLLGRSSTPTSSSCVCTLFLPVEDDPECDSGARAVSLVLRLPLRFVRVHSPH